MRAIGGGGGGGTIVLDPEGLRRNAALLDQAADAFGTIGGRLRGTAYPEMPPGVREHVVSVVTGAAADLASLPAELTGSARELRTRALWADIADKLSAGVELEGAYLDAFKAARANGDLLRYAEPWQADLANEYAEKLREEEEGSGGVLGFLEDVGGGILEFAEGAWDGIKDPLVMLYELTPLNEDWTDRWGDLGRGLAYGVTHPLEFGEALIGLDVLRERGFSYWLGNLAPTVAAAFFTGGGSAALRGTRTVSTLVRSSDDVARHAMRMGRGTYVDDAAAAARRVPYRGFDNALENFNPGAVFHDGPTSGRALVNFHNSERSLEAGQRSLGWWGDPDEALRFGTQEGLRDRMALPQNWDDVGGRVMARDEVSIGYVPEGAPTTHLSGTARDQFDTVTGQMRPGGAYQEAHRDFAPDWILGDVRTDDFWAGRARLEGEVPAHYSPGRGLAGAGVQRGLDTAADPAGP
jgi:hypothetical protein